MFKIASGPHLNLLGRGAGYGASATGPASSATLDSSFPLENAYDGRPSRPMMLDSTTAGFYISFPNNLLINGDFEQGTTGWEVANVTLTSETGAGNFHLGAKSAKLVTTNAYAPIYQNVTVQAGQYLQLRAAAKSDGTNDAYVRVTCLETRKDLAADGTWGAILTTSGCMVKTGNTMTAFTPVTFRAPTFTECGSTTVTIRVLLYGEANAQTLYFDEVLLIPGINFAGIFGHRLDAGTGFALASSGASYWHSPSFNIDFGASSNAIAVRQAAYISKATMLYEPFPAVFFYPGGAFGSYATNQIPYIGELVVGQTSDLASNPDYPVGIEYIYPQTRMETARGDQWVLNRSRHPKRKVTMSFAYFNDAEYQDARDNLYNMSEGGAYPVVLIPTDTDSGDVIYGRVQPGVTFMRNNFITRTAEFVVQEEPFPLMS